MIAHRLSTILNSNNIYVIDAGKVVESGQHVELMKESELYKKFYEKQLKVNMFFYQILITTLLIISPIILILRIIKNKEDKKRFTEKLSIPSKKKSENLIWFHGASVGELISIIPLIKYYEKNKSINQILITTSTLSSYEVFRKFNLKKQFINITL